MAKTKTLEQLEKENRDLQRGLTRVNLDYKQQRKQLNVALEKIRNLENRMSYLERLQNQLSNTVDRITRYFR